MFTQAQKCFNESFQAQKRLFKNSPNKKQILRTWLRMNVEVYAKAAEKEVTNRFNRQSMSRQSWFEKRCLKDEDEE